MPTAAQIVDKVFDPEEWDKPLKVAAAATLAPVMVQGVVAEFRKWRRRGKASTATQAALEYDIDIDGIETEQPEWLTDAIHDSLDNIFKQSYWSEINKTTANDVERLLKRGLEEGHSIRTIAEAIRLASAEYSLRRATAVARTEATGAMNAGHLIGIEAVGEELGEKMGKEWLSVLGNTTRETHADADGQIVGVDEMFDVGGHEAAYPGDPDLPPEERCNCLLGDVPVSGKIVACCRAWYEGPISEIVTAKGRRLRVTPNHPVLTENGFVPACQLQVGQQVIAAKSEVDMATRGAASNNEHDEPALIEDVFQSLLRSRDVSLVDGVEVLWSTPDDFYGDGQFLNGEIELVRHLGSFGNLELRNSDEPFGSEEHADLKFASPNGASRAGAVTASVPRRFKPRGSLRFVSSGPSRSLPIGVAANLDLPFAKTAYENRAADAEVASETLKRNPGFVELDDVVEIRNDEFFHGWVYDPETENGLVAADGIITKQCQCTVISSILMGGSSTKPVEDDEPADAVEPDAVEPDAVEPDAVEPDAEEPVIEGDEPAEESPEEPVGRDDAIQQEIATINDLVRDNSAKYDSIEFKETIRPVSPRKFEEAGHVDDFIDARGELSEAEIATIKDYSEYGYADWNKSLRDGKPGGEDADRLMAAIDRGESFPKEYNVFRGVGSDRTAAKVLEDATASLAADTPMILRGITSTSIDPDAAAQFADSNVLMQFKTSRGMYIADHGQGGEIEILLNHGWSVRITGIVDKDVQVRGDDGGYVTRRFKIVRGVVQ